MALLALHNGICGSFHNKATIHASLLHCLKIKSLRRGSFTTTFQIVVFSDILFGPPTNVTHQEMLVNVTSTDYKSNQFQSPVWCHARNAEVSCCHPPP